MNVSSYVVTYSRNERIPTTISFRGWMQLKNRSSIIRNHFPYVEEFSLVLRIEFLSVNTLLSYETFMYIDIMYFALKIWIGNVSTDNRFDYTPDISNNFYKTHIPQYDPL